MITTKNMNQNKNKEGLGKLMYSIGAMCLLDKLQGREKLVLIHRFGLEGEEPKTLKEVGEIYDVTQERIRQIQEKAKKKLRYMMGAVELP